MTAILLLALQGAAIIIIASIAGLAIAGMLFGMYLMYIAGREIHRANEEEEKEA